MTLVRTFKLLNYIHIRKHINTYSNKLNSSINIRGLSETTHEVSQKKLNLIEVVFNKFSLQAE